MQTRIATLDAFALDPLDYGEYLSRGGFQALDLALRDPAAALAELEESGLRGRGGGGFPSADKWRAVAANPEARRYAICNADEGDPGAFMDRMILESFPFRVLEGLLIASAVIGAEEAFIYVRDEYPLAIERLEGAIEILKREGRLDLGRPPSGAGTGFEVTIVRGAGAFVCGEETALIASLSGRRGIPKLRPPFPSEQGFRGKPTLVNNVETLALVPWILRTGGKSFGEKGSDASRGTKSFALAGKVLRGGLVEVEMGMSLSDVVEKLGGGCAEGETVKAVQVGGPSGGCVSAAELGTPVDYESLKEAGAFMGSGGMVVLDGRDCAVDLARYFLDFTRKESCGNCAPCRIGSTRLHEILEDLCAGRGRKGDLEELERLSLIMKEASLCGLGRSAPNPLLSTLAKFREEYEAHLEGHCPARKCRALIRFDINDGCIGCTRCHQACPEGAIPFNPGKKHFIDQEKCTKCGLCEDACPTGSVERKS
jgi:NADH-quinone oxidoreductase subunit F